jgi:hypothetical protein
MAWLATNVDEWVDTGSLRGGVESISCCFKAAFCGGFYQESVVPDEGCPETSDGDRHRFAVTTVHSGQSFPVSLKVQSIISTKFIDNIT